MLISYVGTVGSIWIVVAVNAALGALFMPPLARVAGLLGSAGLAGILAFTSAGEFAFASPCDEESQYFCIQVDSADGINGRPAKLMALDHLVHSVNDRDDPGRLASPYLHLVDEIALRRFPEGPASAFFVGGGGYTLPRAWQERWPQMQMLVAEIDPLVTRVAEEQLWFTPGPGVRSLHRDGRVALRLKPQGFYVLNLIDDPLEPRFLASMVRTLALSFSSLEVWVTLEDLPGSRRATFILYAAQEPSGLPNRLRALQGYPRQWAQIEVERLEADRLGLILRDSHAPVDRLLSRFWLEGG